MQVNSIADDLAGYVPSVDGDEEVKEGLMRIVAIAVSL